MMLKVGRKVSPSFYALQSLEAQGSTGLHHLKDQTIAGVTFRTFPHDLTAVEILARIKKELDEGRTVGFYLPENKVAHGWIAVELEADAIALLSKCSELGGGEGVKTDELWFPLANVEALNHVDCLFYEE